MSDTSTKEGKEELHIMATGYVLRGKLYLPHNVANFLFLREGDRVEYLQDMYRPGRIYIRKAEYPDRNEHQIKRMRNAARSATPARVD